MLVISSVWWDEADKTQRAAGVSLPDFLALLQRSAQLPPSPVNVWLCVGGSLPAWDSPFIQLAWGRARDRSV